MPFRLHLHDARPDGTRTIFAEMRAHRIESEVGNTKGPTVVAVTRDVSEHSRHAAELDRARTEAERAAEVKSRFIATVSHELRTPLNAIIGFSEVLAGEGAIELPPAQTREYAGIIADSGHHLLGVVNTLLDMSRIQSGHFEFVPEPVEIETLLTGCCDLMRLKANAGQVALVRLPVPAGLSITADARACRQMLINLVSNAVKHTAPGGRVEIGVRLGGNYIDIGIHDNGSGIPEADLPRLGDPFFQAGGGYDRRQEGTGLGLSVVRGLVGLHGGSMSIESAQGEGTSVVVTLPLRAAAIPLSTEPAPLRSSVKGSSPSMDSLRPLARKPIGLFDRAGAAGTDEPTTLRLAG